MIKRVVAILFTTMNYVSKMFSSVLLSSLLFCQSSLTANQPEAEKPVGRVRSVVQSFKKRLDKIGKKTKIAVGVISGLAAAFGAAVVGTRISLRNQAVDIDTFYPDDFTKMWKVFCLSGFKGLIWHESRLEAMLQRALNKCKQELIPKIESGSINLSRQECFFVLEQSIRSGCKYLDKTTSGRVDIVDVKKPVEGVDDYKTLYFYNVLSCVLSELSVETKSFLRVAVRNYDYWLQID